MRIRAEKRALALTQMLEKMNNTVGKVRSGLEDVG